MVLLTLLELWELLCCWSCCVHLLVTYRELKLLESALVLLELLLELLVLLRRLELLTLLCCWNCWSG